MEDIADIIVCGVFAALFFVLGILQIFERGIPLNNEYLFAPAEKRQSMNKKPYFRQSGIAFLGCGAAFAVILCAAVFDIHALYYLFPVLVTATVTYSIISAFIIDKKYK